LITNINGIINPIDIHEKARAIVKRIPNYDESSEGYKVACQLIDEKVTRITV